MGSTYLSAPGILKILVIGAENLDRIVTVGEQQPYYIIECGKQRSRSKPCLSSGTNPHWNTAHKFELVDETAAVAVIKDETTKGIIGEGLIDLSRARLSGRDAATAQLTNLGGQPAGRLRFKLKFQAASGDAADRLSPELQSQRLSDSGRIVGGIHSMVDNDRRMSDTSSMQPSRRVSMESGSMQPRRVSEAGSYRSTGSVTDGRVSRGMTPSPSTFPTGGAVLERRTSGGLRMMQQQQQQQPAVAAAGRRSGQDEPDVVLASVTSKVSLAKQAMQQLTAELAELTGPGQSPSPGLAGGSRGVSPSLSPSASQSAFAAATAQNMPLRSSSQQFGARGGSFRQDGVGLNVLGQPVPQPPPPQQQQQFLQQPQGSNAWQDYRQLYQQQARQVPARRPSGPPAALGGADLGGADSWATAMTQQAQQLRPGRVSTGTASVSPQPSGVFSPSPELSPRAAAAAGFPPSWPRLRGVFGSDVLSTEELVSLYAGAGPSSEKKLINLLEEALAAAHAEKVAAEAELSTVKQAMASMTQQHYLDMKRLKEVTTQVEGRQTASVAAGRSLTPPPRWGRPGTPPGSPHGGGMFSMVDTKPSRSGRLSQVSDTNEIMRDLSPLHPRGLTISTGRASAGAAAGSRAAFASGTQEAPSAAATAAAAAAELASLQREHSKLQSTTAELEKQVTQLKAQERRAEGLERELQRLKDQEEHWQEQQQQLQQQLEQLQQQQKEKENNHRGAAVGAAAGGAIGAAAAAAAAAELEALRAEHLRVRAEAEGLEQEVLELRESQQHLQASQHQLEELQAEHAGVKAALAATQEQLEQLRRQQHELERMGLKENKTGSEFQDAAEDFDCSSSGGSPVPAYKLQIQVHQLERQLTEQAAKTQEEVSKREKLAYEMQVLQEKLEAQLAAAKQAEENARAAEEKAAKQATIAAAARAEAAEVLAHKESSSGKEAQLASELQSVKTELDATLAERAELETALGLLDRNSKEQIEQLQMELAKMQEEAATLRKGNSDVATLQAQLAAVQEEATGLRNNSEEVEYLQAQLRRTLRQVVELQRQVQLLQQERAADPNAPSQDQEAAMDAAIRSEHDFLMQELVATKLELAQVKEQQLITQRQLFKAQESMKQQHSVAATAGP